MRRHVLTFVMVAAALGLVGGRDALGVEPGSETPEGSMDIFGSGSAASPGLCGEKVPGTGSSLFTVVGDGAPERCEEREADASGPEGAGGRR